MNSKNIIRIAIGTAGILLIPLLGKWPWSPGDFIFAGSLLFGSALTYELISRKFSNMAYKAGVALAVVTALMLIWINGAVGIIGDEDNPANLMYLGVVAIGFLGAIGSRFQPKGMARVAYAAAAAQVIVPLIALIINPQVLMEAPGVAGVFGLNAFFAMLWVGSGMLFGQASNNNNK